MTQTQTQPLVLASRSPSGRVLILTMNRPESLNALSGALFKELNAHLVSAVHDDSVACVVLTGGEKVFAAGADIKEMKRKDFAMQFKNDAFGGPWGTLSNFRKPVIAAVAGYAFGGGFELALMCDMIVCSPKALFGLPEVNIGLIPGAGGTQRLTRVVGKARAMEVVLGGKRISGPEAVEWGVANHCVAEGESVVAAAVKVAENLATKGAIALMVGKEAVNAALELPLQQGLTFERRLCHALFGGPDQVEGMTAFIEKRKPNWPSRL